MVGVPGKYKGCNSCRARRVKCDNEKPFCRKCIDSGRECAGYERETVFIIGTIEDGGRCSSHPPRVVKSKKNTPAAVATASSSSVSRAGSTGGTPGSSYSLSPSLSTRHSRQRRSRSREEVMGDLDPPSASGGDGGVERGGGDLIPQQQQQQQQQQQPVLLPEEPLMPAWDDQLSVSSGVGNRGPRCRLHMAALHTSLLDVEKGSDEGGGNFTDQSGGSSNLFTLRSLRMYDNNSDQMFMTEDDFRLRANCLVHVPPSGTTATDDGYCLFLYEHNNSMLFSNQPPWRDPAVQNDVVRRLGPEGFRTFPNHHFFVRVYRHNAICTSLINRVPTFLSSPEWLTAPWEAHPKTAFDTLFDVISQLPSILWRADNIEAQERTLARRLAAQDLLTNCLELEKRFDAWYRHLCTIPSTTSTPPSPGLGDGDRSTTLEQQQQQQQQQHQVLFWPIQHDPLSSNIMPPNNPHNHNPLYFPDGGGHHVFAFPSVLTATALIYYWTTLILFYPAVERLYWAIFEPVIDVPQHHHHININLNLPRHLQQNVDDFHVRYGGHKVRELAGYVCRSLDFTLLRTTQPDLLGFPLRVVRAVFYQYQGQQQQAAAAAQAQQQQQQQQQFLDPVTGNVVYGAVAPNPAVAGVGMGGVVGVGGDDGRRMMDILMWCEGFRGRLMARARDMADFFADDHPHHHRATGGGGGGVVQGPMGMGMGVGVGGELAARQWWDLANY